jgi:hypothetical protein
MAEPNLRNTKCPQEAPSLLRMHGWTRLSRTFPSFQDQANSKQQPINHLALTLSRYWRIETEDTLRIVLVLQRGQTILARLLVPIPALRTLSTIRVIHICVELVTSRTLANDLSQLFTQVLDFSISDLVRRRVDDERSSEDQILTEAERRCVGTTGTNTCGCVVLEHEDGIIVGRLGARDGRCVRLVSFLLRRDVVRLGIDRKSRIVEAEVLAWWRVQRDISPSREVLVGAGLWFDGKRAQIVERLCVLGINSVDTFLDDVHEDDRLTMLAQIS